MDTPNPFFHRGPIRDHTYFFGRKDVVGQAFSLIGNGQSISLVGQRRIGKTSLLLHLATPEIFRQYGLTVHEYLFVYIDCGGLSGLDPPGLYQALLEETRDALTDVQASDPPSEISDQTHPITYRTFERTIRRLTRQGWKLIILLDEFDQMSRNPQLSPDVFSSLRALTARHPIAFVTASRQPLLELTYANASALSSPFFNIFACIRLGLFNTDEARTLLTSLAATAQLTFTPPTLDFILDIAGPHPLFLQIAGFHAFALQQAKDAPLTSQDYPELRRAFCASVEEHFGYYWRHLTPDEQYVLATLSTSQYNRSDIARHLAHECLIVVRRGQDYHYLSSAFRIFVQSQPVSSLLQAGPVAINENERLALCRGHTLNLTQTQYDLLVHLVRQAGQVLTNEALEQAIWGDEYVEDPERLKAVIKGLRRELGTEATLLENVRGVGYVWRGG